jgi:hypothetical protein
MDRDLHVSDVLTMNQLLGKSTLDQSFNATLLVAFATLSLVLAAVGLFGVMSFLAAQRTTEIGIRICARRETRARDAEDVAGWNEARGARSCRGTLSKPGSF